MAKNENDTQKEKGKLSVSRRDFLVTGGAMIAGGALSASSIAAAAQRSGSPESRSRESVVGGGSETLRPGGRTKYGKYVTREIIGESKYPQITAPIAKYDGCRGGGNALTLEWSCITKPFVMDDEPEIDNERDQFLLFYPGDYEKPNEFGAEVEFSIGEKGKKQIITTPTYVYIPKGTRHGLVNFKTIRKPIGFMSYYLSPEYSTGWVAPDESKYVVDLSKPVKHSSASGSTQEGQGPPVEGIILQPVPVIGINYTLWSSYFGWPAKVNPTLNTLGYREYGRGGQMYTYKESQQIYMYLGSNPLDIEDFDVEIDIRLGEEQERYTIETCAVNHIVPGLFHLGGEVRRVWGKPFMKFMWLIGPYSNYDEAASKDKVIFSDPSGKGGMF